VILAAVYERTGSIRPTIALHMINNGIAFAVLVWG
jgi:membrane protease YdiL (CAAX protease family)